MCLSDSIDTNVALTCGAADACRTGNIGGIDETGGGCTVLLVIVVLGVGRRLRSTQITIVNATKKRTPRMARTVYHEIPHGCLLSVSLSFALLQRHTENVE